MPNYYYHYTSRYNAQGIFARDIIAPGMSGYIYLSDRLYATGAEASNGLGIGHKPVEICFCIPHEHLEDQEIQPPEVPQPAAPWDEERDGGDNEYTVGQAIQRVRVVPIILMRTP